ncbi:MAG: HDIG domain-containing protein [Phycisphaerales bacterium]|nr:HDIG domain-containing protein [Phycisphaerales bacterium]
MSRPGTRSASRTGPRSGVYRRVGGALGSIRDDGLWRRAVRAVRTREFGWAAIVTGAFWLVSAAVMIWARAEARPVPGRVAVESRLSRVPLTLPNDAATQAARAEARLRSPRVYVAEQATIDEIRTSLLNLPRTVGEASKVEDVDPAIAQQFSLTPAQLAALKEATFDGEPSQAWTNRVDALAEGLSRRPLLDDIAWQRLSQQGLGEIELRGRETRRVPASLAVNIAAAGDLTSAAESLVRAAGFRGEQAEVALARLIVKAKATFHFDEASTVALAAAAERAVAPLTTDLPKGYVIYTRGDVLATAQVDLDEAERRAFDQSAPLWRAWARSAAYAGGAGILAVALAGYVGTFVPRIRRSPARMLWLGVLVGGLCAVASVSCVLFPAVAPLAAPAPVLLAAIILVIAYDQRTALACGSIAGLLVCLTLDLSIARFMLMVGGVGLVVRSLPEIRDRGTLVRTGVVAGIGMALGTGVASLIEGPVTPALLRQAVFDSALGGGSGLIAAGLAMFLLPTIERVFDIATGMTLIELRDPKHPLLRELQQRAPGTYNHSLTVASIAEAAADAIGADSLLTYVGALYHDIGKMNKPEYFVENQGGGPNRHDKLSPAMSLLVIVGHVKDGAEMARESGLPKPLIHFIEAHHGTTLVEYFFRRARDQADAAQREGDDVEQPTESDFRYPGPKPQTREVAILMLADAVESATRTLSEPTPARIDNLVRTLANKRLLDEQFEACGLTFRELSQIVDSISKSVAAIYHGRIHYPTGEPRTAERTGAEPKTSARQRTDPETRSA